MMKPIFLCGFMGCGKSTIGKLLASKLNLEFIDADTYIEQSAGMNIPDIFRLKGEQHFRELEYECCKELAQRKNCIVATGGGMLTFARCWNAIKECGIVIYLDPSFQVCYQRIKNSNRPLVVSNSKEELCKLYQKRHSLYRSHSHFALNNQQSPGEMVENIIACLKNID